MANQILKINSVKSIKGNIEVPGDKSISHRSLMLPAIAHGESRIIGLSTGADVRSTRQCLQQLGVEIRDAEDDVLVTGKGSKALCASATPLDAGNSGTTLRLLSGILAAQTFTTRIKGDASLSRRPMKRIITPLELMGARIESSSQETAPLTIQGGELKAIRYELPVASAQVKSCVLFAGLGADGQTTVVEPTQTRDHSERMLTAMGAVLRDEDNQITIEPSLLHALDIQVPGDFSSAAFFLAAASLLPDSELKLVNININPTRIPFLNVLQQMGAKIEVEEMNRDMVEPIANIHVQQADLHGIHVDEKLIPFMIDEIPILAVLATQAEGKTQITGAGELRVKESDRIMAVVKNLKAMGANVEELPDGMIIHGPTKLHGAAIDSFDDHRIAMSFAVAGLLANSPTNIHNPECANISFPGFFDILKSRCC